MIEKCVKLERLNISNNKLNRRGFAELKPAISSSKALKLLEAKYNQIPSTEIVEFVELLKFSHNDTLLYVDLSGNKI
jgi:Leucine-rich repeat (LRR) protein